MIRHWLLRQLRGVSHEENETEKFASWNEGFQFGYRVGFGNRSYLENAPVAQSVEPVPHKNSDSGSNPDGRTTDTGVPHE